MNFRVIPSLILTSSFINFPSISYAYNEDSHRRLSEEILLHSNLMSYLPLLGLNVMEDKLTFYSNDDRFADVTRSVGQWFLHGTKQEDAIFSINPARFRNHFYDPIAKMGYSYHGLSGEMAPRWALENEQDFGTQEYSLKDAQDYLYRGITALDSKQRETHLAKTFESLGHVLHVLQDMTSVPHTRADSHGGYIVFGALSLYETYSETVFSSKRHPNESVKKYQARQERVSNLLSASYPEVHFPKAYDWWTTSEGTGLADYTNRGFVSEDTNFDDHHYTSPEPTGTTSVSIQDLYQKELGEPVPKEVIDGHEVELKGEVDFIGSVVEDRYTGETVYHPRASTRSIFDSDLKRYNVEIHFDMDHSESSTSQVKTLYTLNRFNFDSFHQFLIPRTVAYGAGLVNHVFRGRLEIMPPDGDIYVLVDHAQVNQKEEGFNKVKLKIKNVTSAVSGRAQNLEGGHVTLVARYYRNPCYEPDLSGERKVGRGRWNACQKIDQEEYLNASKEESLGSLEAQGEAVEKTFEFDQPIPLNAVELKFQVVYRGKMGGEEAVAMGTKEMSEATYSTWANHTDYFSVDGSFYTPETILGTPSLKERWKKSGKPSLAPADIWVELQGGQVKGHLSSGTYFRIAMLVSESIKLAYFIYTDYGFQGSGYRVVPARQDLFDHGYGLDRERNSIYWHIVNFFIDVGIGSYPSSEAFDQMGDFLDPSPQTLEVDF